MNNYSGTLLINVEVELFPQKGSNVPPTWKALLVRCPIYFRLRSFCVAWFWMSYQIFDLILIWDPSSTFYPLKGENWLGYCIEYLIRYYLAPQLTHEMGVKWNLRWKYKISIEGFIFGIRLHLKSRTLNFPMYMKIIVIICSYLVINYFRACRSRAYGSWNYKF